MLDLSSYKTIATSSSLSTSSGRVEVTKVEVLDDTLVRCRGCKAVMDRQFVDFRLRCDECAKGRCGRCYRDLNDDGDCIVCIELEVVTDEETDARRERGEADELGNQCRPPLLTEDDEYNAYSAGVVEYGVDDESITAIRRVDEFNEDRREWRGQKTTNGVCPKCSLELALVDRAAGIHPDCED